MGEILKRVQRREALETRQVEAWSPDEVRTLLGVAREGHSPFLYPLLVLLLGTGVRRGEALALKWADVDFSRGRILVRRSWSRAHLGTPKSGRRERWRSLRGPP